MDIQEFSGFPLSRSFPANPEKTGGTGACNFELHQSSFQMKGKIPLPCFTRSGGKIAIKAKDRIEFIPISQIIKFTGDDKYAEMHLIQRVNPIRVFHSLREIQNGICFSNINSESPFIRINRSCIINGDCIQFWLADNDLILSDGMEVTFSSGAEEDFLRFLRNPYSSENSFDCT